MNLEPITERCRWCRLRIRRGTWRWLHIGSKSENCAHGGTVATPRDLQAAER